MVYKYLQYKIATGLTKDERAVNDDQDYLYITFASNNWMYVNSKKFWLQIYDAHGNYMEGWKADHFTIGYTELEDERLINIHRTLYKPTELPYLYERQRPSYCDMLLNDIYKTNDMDNITCYFTKARRPGQRNLQQMFTSNERIRLKLLLNIGLERGYTSEGGTTTPLVGFKGRKYKVRQGPRGGQYIVVKGQKVYMNAVKSKKGGYSSTFNWDDANLCQKLYDRAIKPLLISSIKEGNKLNNVMVLHDTESDNVQICFDHEGKNQYVECRGVDILEYIDIPEEKNVGFEVGVNPFERYVHVNTS
jgi:hypothetical protein